MATLTSQIVARVYLFNITDKGFELVSSFKTDSGAGPSIAYMAGTNGLLFIRHGTALMAYSLKQVSRYTPPS